jgi:hypothetical protein
MSMFIIILRFLSSSSSSLLCNYFIVFNPTVARIKPTLWNATTMIVSATIVLMIDNYTTIVLMISMHFPFSSVV